MEQRRIQSLIISGLCALCSCLQHEHHLVGEPKTWTEAQRYCREKHTDLVTMESVADAARLLSALSPTFDGRAWIGLKMGGVSKWKWSLYRKGDNILWNTGGFPGFEHCVVMHNDGQGYSYYCDARFPSVCYDEATKGYSLVLTEMAWWEAQRYCRDRYTDLARVINVAQQSSVMVAAQGHYVWVGLFRDNWAWSDKSPSSFRQWAEPQVPSEPNSCAATSVVRAGQWEVFPCSTTLPFLCRGALRGKLFLWKMKIRTDTDLTDNALSDKLLQQINQIMANQGLSDYELRWRARPKIALGNEEEEEEKVVKEERGFCGA